MTNAVTSTEDRALTLLGQGVSAEATAAALGVNVSRISQLLSDDGFAERVSNLRYENLQKHNIRDNEYDEIEDELLKKLRQTIPLMMRPMEILKSVAVINAAKRRGQSTPESILEKQQIVAINLPAVIVNNYTHIAPVTNVHNQVVKVGEKDLTTMQSGTLLKDHKETKMLELRAEETSNEQRPKEYRTKRFDPTNV